MPAELARVRGGRADDRRRCQDARSSIGWLTLVDELRPGAAAAVAALQRVGVAVTMLTGDHPAPAAAIAKTAGIGEWRAEQLPEDKRAAIVAMQKQGRIVGMVGDGVNDAPALAQADVSFAMGAGAGSALSAADVTLLRNDLAAVAAAVDLSRATLSKIRQNLFFAFFFNALGIPLAALGLLSPVIAGAAMAASSVSVVGNALLLKRWRPPVRRVAVRAQARDRPRSLQSSRRKDHERHRQARIRRRRHALRRLRARA